MKTNAKHNDFWIKVSFVLWTSVLVIALSSLTGCGVDGPTISYGDTGEYDSSIAELGSGYPRYFIACVDRCGLETMGNGAFTRVIFDIPNIEQGNNIAVSVPSVCMDDISVGTYCYLIEHDKYAGYCWAGLNPDLSEYPVVNDVIATERVN